MKAIIGVISVVLVALSLVPNFVPGAMSLFGLGVTLLGLVLSVFSVKNGKLLYFKVTLGLTVIGVLVVDDTKRVDSRHTL